MNNLNIFTQIRNWAKDRNLIEGATTHAQMLKLTEEVGELAGAIAKGKTEETKLEIGDCVVVLTILAMQNGVWIEDCIAEAYEKIRHRKGKMINGVFVKDGDAPIKINLEKGFCMGAFKDILK